MAYGQNGHIGISMQSTWGVANTSSMEYYKFISESLSEKIEDVEDESLNSMLDEPDNYVGMHSIEGEVAMMAHPILAGKLFKLWAGQSSMHAYVGSCYQHIFAPLQSDWLAEVCALPPATIEIYRDTGSAYLFYDCLLNTLNLEIAQGALYKMSAGWIGAQFAWAAMTTPSYEGGSFYTWDTCSVSLAGTAVSHISQLTIAMNNALSGKGYLDLKNYPSRILRDGRRTVEISGTMLLVGDTEVRNWRARTNQRLLITATDPATIMGAHNQLICDVPQMRYTEFPANIGGPGLMEVGFSAKARYDATSSYAIQMTMTNTRGAY